MTMKVKVDLFSGGCPELIREQGTPRLVCKVDQQIPAPAPTLHTAGHSRGLIQIICEIVQYAFVGNI